MNLKKENESAQSFIFRVLLINGETSFRGLFNNTGKWLRQPFVQSSCTYLFEHFDHEHLLELLFRSDIIEEPEGVFSDPFANYEVLSDVFFKGYPYSNHVHTGNAVEVRYCPECIKQDLHDVGFGYFHASWLFSNYCGHHHQALFYIVADTLASTRGSLETVINGKHPTNSKPCEMDSGLEPILLSPFFASPKIAPCVQKKLLHWLRKNCDELDAKCGTQSKIKQTLMSSTGKYNEINSAELERLMSVVHDTNKDLLDTFFKNTSTLIDVSKLLSNYLHFNKYRVINERNCSKCVLYTEGYKCHESQHIRLKDDPEKKHIFYQNPCDYYLLNKRHYWNEYSTKSLKLRDEAFRDLFNDGL